MLTPLEAYLLADHSSIHLSGHTGEHTGIIGALAAVGLRRSGADGRYLDLPGLRELTGTQQAAAFMRAGVDRFLSESGKTVDLAPDKMIAIGEKWPQPILRDGRASLLVESDDGNTDWRVAGRDLVKRESN